jgi:hypothetical protein
MPYPKQISEDNSLKENCKYCSKPLEEKRLQFNAIKCFECKNKHYAYYFTNQLVDNTEDNKVWSFYQCRYYIDEDITVMDAPYYTGGVVTILLKNKIIELPYFDCSLFTKDELFQKIKMYITFS